MKNKVGVFGMLVLSLFMGCGLMKKQPAIRIDYSVEASSGEMSTRFAEMMMDSISVTLYPAQEIQMMKWKSYLSTYFLVSASDLKYLAIKTENDTTIFFGAEMMDELNKFNFPFYELDKTSRDCHTIGLEAKRRTVAFDSLSNEIEYADEYKNKLPVFEAVPGIPLKYVLNLCGDIVNVNAKNKLLIQEGTVDIPKAAYPLDFQAKTDGGMGGILIHGKLRNDITDEEIPFLPIAVMKGNEKVGSLMTACDASYELRLDYGYRYELLFGGDDFVTKKVVIDGIGIPADDTLGYEIAMDGRMIARKEGVDYSLLDEPMSIAKYDSVERMIVFDLEYTKNMMKKIEGLGK